MGLKEETIVELNTIQKREKLNEVSAVGEQGPGGAYHLYEVSYSLNNGFIAHQRIAFQKGAREQSESQPGLIDTDLLEMVRHRLQCFQEGEYATRENQMALDHIEHALLWLNKRVEDRIERNVLGTSKK